jgi:hypothetical protein
VEGLAEKLEWLAGHRAEAVEMGREAAGRARVLSWERHGERVAELVAEFGGGGGVRSQESGVRGTAGREGARC